MDGIRKVELALGNRKFVNDKEKTIRQWAFRSIVSVSEIKSTGTSGYAYERFTSGQHLG